MEHNIYNLVFKVTHAGGSGSCFYLKSCNLFVTNYHVVEGFHSVALHDSNRNPYLARVVLVNAALDIALLSVDHDFSYLPDLTIAAEDSLGIGGKIRVAGYPYGMPFTVTEGTVSAPKQLMNGQYYIQTDAAVNPGNSGGPIFNDHDEIVGITVSKFTDADNMGFGIRVEALHKVLEATDGLDRNTFQVQCESCDELISEPDAYCPSCGEELPEGIFDERPVPQGEFRNTHLRVQPRLPFHGGSDKPASQERCRESARLHAQHRLHTLQNGYRGAPDIPDVPHSPLRHHRAIRRHHTSKHR